MLWEKDAENIYKNFCQEEFDLQTFEFANAMLGCSTSPEKSNKFSLDSRKRGNLYFSANQWQNAIRAYNISLCFAETDSEQMSLAYGNRSACFLHLKMYGKCLVDIEMALQGKIPERLIAKLEDRKAVCLKRIEKNDQVDAFEPELSFDAHCSYPSMANVLQIKWNDHFGRHVTACDDIGVGKILLKEKAFLPSIFDKYKRCDTCWKNDVNLIPCTKCTSVLFCTGSCEQSPAHTIQCGVRVLSEEFVNDQQMQLQRSILIAVEEFSSVDDLMNFVEAAIKSDPMEIPTSLTNSKSVYRAFLKLPFDRKTVLKDTFAAQVSFNYKKLLTIRAFKSKFSSKNFTRFLMHLIGHHLCVIQSNSGAFMYGSESPFNIQQNLSENVSILVNYINHSCAPNVCIISVNDFNVCITLRPIKSGDQLFVSYFRNDALKHSTVNRQKYLRDVSEFHCNCERCVISTRPKELEEMKSDSCYQYLQINAKKWDCCTKSKNELFLRLCSCANKITDHDADMMQKKCVEFLNKYGHTTWTPELDFVINCYVKVLKFRV